MKKKRKPMARIITRKISFRQFKINKNLFKQAAALAKFKKVSIISLLSDYLTIGVVSAAEAACDYLGIDEWTNYCDVAWEEANRAEKPLPRFNKKRMMNNTNQILKEDQQPSNQGE